MGAEGVREMMEMTPCDIFGYIRGRTVWLVGDSMMQVRWEPVKPCLCSISRQL